MISIQQPEFFPWLGYFHKIASVDAVVFLDNVQFKKRYFENRNKVRTVEGWSWLRVPVLSKGRYTQDIADVEIDTAAPWKRKLAQSLTVNYRKAPFWTANGEPLLAYMSDFASASLSEFNIGFIEFIMSVLAIEKPTTLASSLGTEKSGSDLILEINRAMSADRYFSGVAGRDYLIEDDFKNAGIQIEYQDFHHPVYDQLWDGPFQPYMSVIDPLFVHGADATRSLIMPPKKES